MNRIVSLAAVALVLTLASSLVGCAAPGAGEPTGATQNGLKGKGEDNDKGTDKGGCVDEDDKLPPTGKGEPSKPESDLKKPGADEAEAGDKGGYGGDADDKGSDDDADGKESDWPEKEVPADPCGCK
jgi:hypothetical protein